MSHRRITLMLLAAAVLAALLPALTLAQQPLPAEGDEAALLAVLKNADAPLFDKAKACQRLAVIGTAKSVPVLAGMLADEKLGHYARFGLEPIPDPAVDAALRAALGKLEGLRLVGVINSIGNRGDEGAIGDLKKLLASKDQQVAAAAAAALGRMATPDCVAALKQALSGPAGKKPCLGDACLAACDRLMAAGRRDEAGSMYEALLAASQPKFVQVAATYGAIVARGPAGLPRMIECLKSHDKGLFGAGLRAAYKLPADQVAPAVVAELKKIEPPAAEKAPKLLSIVKAEYGSGDTWRDVTDKLAAAMRDNRLNIVAGNNLAGDPTPSRVKELRLVYRLGAEEKSLVIAENDPIELAGDKMTAHPRQVVLISVLGELGDKSALPVIVEAAQCNALDVRVAALRALATLGDRQSVPVLVKAAVEAYGEPAAVAMDSASALKGDGVDQAVVDALGKTEGPRRAVVIDLIGRRGISSALPALIWAADDKDPKVSLAAIRALGMTIGPDDFDALIKRLIAPAGEEELAAVRDALKTAALRSPDREACAAKLLAATADAPVAARCAVLDLLGWLGGEKALAAVAAAAEDSNDEFLQDTATEVLGRWMTPDAGPVLLELAKTLDDEKYKVRAMRGYIRIPRQLGISDQEKLAMFKLALSTAWRDAEKKLVLDSLARVRSPQSLAIAVEQLDNPALAEHASEAALAIGREARDQEPKTGGRRHETRDPSHQEPRTGRPGEGPVEEGGRVRLARSPATGRKQP